MLIFHFARLNFMRRFSIFTLFTAISLLTAAYLFSQSSPPEPVLQRKVHGQVLTSNDSPAAEIHVDDHFHYAGGQRFILYGVAEAEQHFFIQAAKNGQIERFYWFQFEHYLPDNDHTYKYPEDHIMSIGGLNFIDDARVYADYSGGNANPDSDGARARALLKKAGFILPAATARIRMVHLPDSAHRSELMIIYAEALPANTKIPAAANGVNADEQFPEIAKALRQRAAAGLQIAAGAQIKH